MPAVDKEFTEGVKVTADAQSSGATVRVSKGVLPATIPQSGGFKPYRQVINLKLDTGTTPAPGQRVRFDPPVTLRLRYRADDLQRATNAGKALPVFYYWDNNQWVGFANPQPVLDTTPGFVGAVEVKISDWPGDPPVGVGT